MLKLIIIAAAAIGVYLGVSVWYPKAWEYGFTIQGFFISFVYVAMMLISFAIMRGFKAK